MNLKITIANYVLITPIEDASVVVRAFEKGKIYHNSWDGKIGELADEKLSFSFVGDAYAVPPTDVVKKLQEEKQASDARWIDYYNKFTVEQKRVKELEEKLERISGAVTGNENN